MTPPDTVAAGQWDTSCLRSTEATVVVSERTGINPGRSGQAQYARTSNPDRPMGRAFSPTCPPCLCIPVMLLQSWQGRLLIA